MSTRAVIELIGSKETWFDKFALYKHHDGYPVGIAARLEEIIGKSREVGGYSAKPDATSDFPYSSLLPEDFISSGLRFEPLRVSDQYPMGQEYHYIIDVVNNSITTHEIDLSVSKVPTESNLKSVESINNFIEKHLFTHPDYIEEARKNGIDASNQRIIPMGDKDGQVHHTVCSFALSDNLIFEANKALDRADHTDPAHSGNRSFHVNEAWKYFAKCADAGVSIPNVEQLIERFKAYAERFADSYAWTENRPGGLQDAAKNWGQTFYTRRGYEPFDLSPASVAPSQNKRAEMKGLSPENNDTTGISPSL